MAPRRARQGFTLVEILVVVVVLGILAALTVPSFTEASQESRRAAFVTELRRYVEAAILYENREGSPLPDLSSGTASTTWAMYVNQSEWESVTPIGGVWDAEYNSFGVRSGIGVHFDGTGDTQDAAFMLQIDEVIDDGDLTTGGFRQLAADRFYSIFN